MRLIKCYCNAISTHPCGFIYFSLASNNETYCFTSLVSIIWENQTLKCNEKKQIFGLVRLTAIGFRYYYICCGSICKAFLTYSSNRVTRELFKQFFNHPRVHKWRVNSTFELFNYLVHSKLNAIQIVTLFVFVCVSNRFSGHHVTHPHMRAQPNGYI